MALSLPTRSLAALSGLLLLGACGTVQSWWSGETEPSSVQTQNTTKSGSLLARLLPQDDEQAIDARDGTRAAARETPAKPVRRIVVPRTGAGAKPPKLNVLYVNNGRIRAYGASVIVRGTVEDDGDVALATINGKPAEVKDRAFSRRLNAPMGETEVVVRAEDDDGNAVETRFFISRQPLGQRLTPQRPVQQELASPEYRFLETAAGAPGPRLEDQDEPGVYMILLAGTPAAHYVRMPGLAQCREAVEYTENAVCTFHRGRN